MLPMKLALKAKASNECFKEGQRKTEKGGYKGSENDEKQTHVYLRANYDTTKEQVERGLENVVKLWV